MKSNKTMTVDYDHDHFTIKLKWSCSQVMVSVFIFSMLLFITSCTSRKKTVAPTPAKSYEWLISKVDIDVEGNNQEFKELSGQLRMRRDSIVWFSVTAAMGMEVVRIKVSTDSAWVINRFEKTYLAEPLDSIVQYLGLPISLPWIETLLLDNNEGVPPVENQTVLLKNFAFGPYSAKIKYSNIQLNKETSFPLKITYKMERILLPKKK